jgi:hypothetical protein
MDIQSLKRNSAAAAEGRWVDDIPSMPGVRLRVRGLTSIAAVNCRRKKERQADKKDRERGGGFKPEAEMRISREVLHEAILLEWDGLTNGGAGLPYSADVAAQFLLDPDFDAFAGAVTWAAAAVDQDETDTAGEEAGNSKRQSSGK